MKNKLGLELDQKVLVETQGLSKKYNVAIFKGYYPGNENPYLVEIQKENFLGERIGSFLTGVKEGDIRNMEYKPYDEPKIEWVMEETFLYKDGFEYVIGSLSINGLVTIMQIKPIKDNPLHLTLKELLEYKDKDGNPFGELIK